MRRVPYLQGIRTELGEANAAVPAARRRAGGAWTALGALVRTALTGSIAFGLLAFPMPDTASAQDAARQRLAQVLSGYESIPDASWWRARGPQTVAALRALYRDAQLPAFVRQRAVRAASFYATPEAREFLLAVAREPRQKDRFIREALLGLARAFNNGAGDEIAAFLDHERPLVRRAAAEALGKMKTDAWRPAIEQRLKSEHDGAVRAALQQALAK